MQPPRVILLITAFMCVTVTSSAPGGTTDDPIDCRIYTLGAAGSPYRTPAQPFAERLVVSFFNASEEDDDRAETTIHLVGSANESESVSIYINFEAQVILRSGGTMLGAPLQLPSHGRGGTWASLVLALHDSRLVVYSLEDPVGVVMSAEVSLKGNVSSFVASSTPTHLALDCPAGCHVHDGRSPLVGRWLPLPPSLNLFVSASDQNGSSAFGLAFKSEATDVAGLKKVQLDVGRWHSGGGVGAARGRWHKVQISRDGNTPVRISWGDGGEKKVDVAPGQMLFSVSNASSVLWSLHCFPDVARGQEAWLNRTSHDPDDPNQPEEENQTADKEDQKEEEKEDEGEKEEEGNVGEGQVWAWVLTGLAFFLVMVLALALCTRMRPRHEVTSHGDYLPSIGIVSHRHMPETGGREAEEMSEPGSPTIPVPVINHKLPEENDHSTKKL